LGQLAGQAGAEQVRYEARWSADASKVRKNGGREAAEETGRQARVIVENDESSPASRATSLDAMECI
jgi:hypothetical protein